MLDPRIKKDRRREGRDSFHEYATNKPPRMTRYE
jgi:hypothetical protein